jgi:hypothetical protein
MIDVLIESVSKSEVGERGRERGDWEVEAHDFVSPACLRHSFHNQMFEGEREVV